MDSKLFNKQFMLIGPAFVQQTFGENRSHHMIIPQLLKESAYKKFYASHRFHMTILDNGAFETSVPMNLKTLAETAKSLNVTHAVMPDDIDANDPTPEETFKHTCTIWNTIPEARKITPIYVVHGKDPSEYCRRAVSACVMQNESSVPFTIALPSICLRRNSSRGIPDDVLRPRALDLFRGAWLSKFIDPKFKLKDRLIPHLHLFGVVSYKELQHCLHTLFPITQFITFDSVDPVKLATQWTATNPYEFPPSKEVLIRRIEYELQKFDNVGPA